MNHHSFSQHICRISSFPYYANEQTVLSRRVEMRTDRRSSVGREPSLRPPAARASRASSRATGSRRPLRTPGFPFRLRNYVGFIWFYFRPHKSSKQVLVLSETKTNITHTLNKRYKKSKSSVCEACFCGKKRASVPAARVTDHASLSVTNQPVNAVRPDRSKKKSRCKSTVQSKTIDT